MTEADSTLYLELLKKVLTNRIQMDNRTEWLAEPDSGSAEPEAQPNMFSAHTMVSPEGLDTVQYCVERALADKVPGDLIETGVWRGGICVLMRAVLKAHGVTDRRVWVADSFQGVPTAGEDSHPLDQEMGLHNLNTVLSVSADAVRAVFASYDLLDDQVEFLEGWFNETLPGAPLTSLAVLRLDGDLYESTMDSLTELYPKLSPGGFVIVDDYNLTPCRTAIHEYRDAHGIKEEIKPADSVGVYWRKDF
ncbi:TylF/MycF/NovP-related O-methyltransferase [Streptomyces sp. NPDC015127]|uniref:TylF/MycF/NovP-related O-methyltransferase n=1 Tax=Streptomyces sp. NPDC015127 TaxID=3364939 RepID=UPI0036FC3393